MSTPAPVNKLKAAMQGMAAPKVTELVIPRAAPESDERAPSLAPSRRGKRNVSAYVASDAAKQLRLLAAELDKSTQSLVEEALNDLFRKYNKSAVA